MKKTLLAVIFVMLICAVMLCACKTDSDHENGPTADPSTEACEHVEVVDEAVAPSCTAEGKTAGKHCSVCGEILLEQASVAALGHTPEVDAGKAATCTAAGLTEGKHCSVCNEVLVAQTAIDALGHTEVVDAGKAATCTTTGLTEGKHCSVCNEVLVAQKEVAALGHKEIIKAGVAATCTEDGLSDGKECSVCKAVLLAQTTIPALGHTEVKDAAVKATCTESGLTEGKHCSICNAVLVAQTKVDALGHTEVVDAAVAATCTEDGLSEGKHCSVCNQVIVAQELIAAAHQEAVLAGKAATCETTGLTDGVYCTVCNEILVEQAAISTLPHIHAIMAAKAPTCTEDGLTEGRYCSVCNQMIVAQRVIEALGHTEVIDEAVEATCTEDGLTEGMHCSECDEVLVAQTVVEAYGHTEVVDAAVKATCTEDGLTEGAHCSECDEVLVAQTVVEAYGHTEVVDAAIKATCTEDGLTEGKHCDTCGEVFVAQEVVPAGHTEVVDAAVAPTCTKDGLTEGKHCSACGEILVAQQPVDALGHTEVVDAGKPASCTVDGITEGKHCFVCGEVLVAQETIKASHKIVVDAGKKPTCTVTGLSEGEHCSACGEVFKAQEVLTAKGHTSAANEWLYNNIQHYLVCDTCGDSFDFANHDESAEICDCGYEKPSGECDHQYTLTWIKEKEATCTQDGSKGYFVCPNCYGWFEDAEATMPITDHTSIKVEAKGHVESVDKKASEPDCTNPGNTVRIVCTTCHTVLVEAEEIPALGHTEVIDAAEDATCIKSGKTQGSHCSVCSTVLVAQVTIPASGEHNFEQIESHAATCTEEGYTRYQCADCFEQKETRIPANGHTIATNATWVTVVDTTTGKPVLTPVANKACHYTGTKVTACATCGEEISEKYAIVEHKYESAISTPSTCMTEGVRTYTCTQCDVSYTEAIAIDANAHVWSEEAVNGKYICTVEGCTSTKIVVDYTQDVSAGLNKETLESAKDTDLEVNLKEATIKLDSSIVNEFSEQGLDVDLSADKIDESKRQEVTDQMDEASKELLGDKPIYDFNLMVENEKVSFNGNMTVTLPYELKEGENPQGIVVAYIADDGTVTLIPATYANGFVTFVTDHFSLFTPLYLEGAERCAIYGHSYYDVEVQATCLTSGYTTRVCHHCEEQDPDAYVEIPAKGHAYEGVVTPATCQAQGYTVFTCGECNHSYVGDYTDITAHTMVVDVTIMPTCTEEGYSVYKCSDCSYTRKADFVAAIDHHFGDAVESKAASCTEQGIMTAKCTRPGCAQERHSAIPATGHTLQINAAVKPDCTTDGHTQEIICSECDEVLVPATILPASIAIIKLT